MKAKKKPAAKPKPPERFDTPEALAKYDAKTFEVLGEKQRAMREARAEYTAAKERASDLKKVYEAARVEYEDALDDRKKYRGQKPPGVQQELPFERKADPAVDGAHEPKAAEKSPTATEFEPDAPHADLWRQFPVSRWTIFGLAPGDVKKLSEGKIKGTSKAHPIITVGDLSDFTQPFASDPTRNYNFADIVGLGEAGATRISDAQIRFFNEWNTKGLAAEFAREMGVKLDEPTADGSGRSGVDGAGDTGSGGKGGDGQSKGEPGSPGKRGKKPPKPKHHKRLPRVGGQSTPKINPSGVDPAAPFAGDDEHPPTVPFDDGRQAAGKEPKSDAGGEEAAAAAGA